MKKLLFLSLLFLPLLGRSQVKALKYEIEDSGKTSSQMRSAGTYIETIKITRPKANTTATGLTEINPHLPNLLKDFTKLISTAEVSSRYQELYDRKISLLKEGSYSTAHNFFDCETVLRLKHPETERIALWVQADMDVVTDGSDPGRSSKIEDYDLARSSDWFLPQTSYSWRREDTEPKNPFLDYYPGAVKELEEVKQIILKKQEADKGVVWREILDTVDDQIYRMKYRGMKQATIDGLNKRRYLEATRDPFVVLPIPWVNKNVTWGPQIGDYAAVIYEDKIYPAILGDAGPSDKVGEASLKIARGINPKASGRNRAVSDVTVSYIFFPRTASPRAEPDHQLWRTRVAELLKDIGGIYSMDQLHKWD